MNFLVLTLSVCVHCFCINFTLFNFRLRDMYKRLDDKYIKPCLLRENHVRDPKIIETYENLTERDALGKKERSPKIVESVCTKYWLFLEKMFLASRKINIIGSLKFWRENWSIVVFFSRVKRVKNYVKENQRFQFNFLSVERNFFKWDG